METKVKNGNVMQSCDVYSEMAAKLIQPFNFNGDLLPPFVMFSWDDALSRNDAGGMKDVLKAIEKIVFPLYYFSMKQQAEKLALTFEDIKAAEEQHEKIMKSSPVLIEACQIIDVINSDVTRVEYFKENGQLEDAIRICRRVYREVRMLVEGDKFTEDQPLWTPQQLWAREYLLIKSSQSTTSSSSSSSSSRFDLNVLKAKSRKNKGRRRLTKTLIK